MGGGIYEKPIRREDCLKMGAWTVCRFKRRVAWQEREGWCFGEGGVNTSMHTVYHYVLS